MNFLFFSIVHLLTFPVSVLFKKKKKEVFLD